MKITFNCGESARMTHPAFGITPKMGRAYWGWIPHLTWNKGLPWKDQCCGMTLTFLCYWVRCTIWRS